MRQVSYLYRIGFGEAYLVELMTIATMSCFLFFTSFLLETQQLMQQVSDIRENRMNFAAGLLL